MKAAAKNLIKCFIIIFGLIAPSDVILGQTQKPDHPISKVKYQLGTTKIKYDFTQNQTLFLSNPSLSFRNDFQSNIPMVYSFENLALFCKIEEKVSQKSNLAMRMRLGSLDYVNALEGKHHNIKLNN